MVTYYVHMTFENPKRTVKYIPLSPEEVKNSVTETHWLLRGTDSTPPMKEEATYTEDGTIRVETASYASLDDAVNAANKLRAVIQGVDHHRGCDLTKWRCTAYTIHTKGAE